MTVFNRREKGGKVRAAGFPNEIDPHALEKPRVLLHTPSPQTTTLHYEGLVVQSRHS
jgi:hypothetical protein